MAETLSGDCRCGVYRPAGGWYDDYAPCADCGHGVEEHIGGRCEAGQVIARALATYVEAGPNGF